MDLPPVSPGAAKTRILSRTYILLSLQIQFFKLMAAPFAKNYVGLPELLS